MFPHNLCVVNMWRSFDGSVNGKEGKGFSCTGRAAGLLFVVKTVLRGYSALTRSVAAGTTGTALGSMGNIMLPYALYNHSECMFVVLESRKDEISTD